MKQLVFVLTLYFVSLSVLPCMDAGASLADCGTETERTDPHDGEPHTEEGTEDPCSPFCSCHCCHVHSIQLAEVPASLITPPVQTKKAPLMPLLYSKELFSIWHPPRA